MNFVIGPKDFEISTKKALPILDSSVTLVERMSPSASIDFTEDNIYRLFGNEAAENESLPRLKEYYFKSKTYEQIVGTLPLRLLVGHKGIGKSALFKIAISEDPERGYLPVSIRPDDIVGIGRDTSDFLALIHDWKQGLIKIISHKILESFGVKNSNEILSKVTWATGQVASILIRSVKDIEKRADLTAAQRLLINNFLRNHVITIYIDDLDRGWEGKPQDIKKISALLNAVRDLSADNASIRFRIALRSDVYFLYRTSDESTDKIDGSVIWYSWTNHDILLLLVKRVETFLGRQFDETKMAKWEQYAVAKFLDPVMQPRFYGQGKWENIPTYRMLMSLIRKRPRDLVKLSSLAARNAYDSGSNLIGTEHFSAIFNDYSQGRVQDAINEYKTELPDIERLIMNMKPTRKQKTAQESYTFATDQLFRKIQSVQQTGEFRFANGKPATEKQLAQFLYKINFLTARKMLPNEEIQRKYFEENRYLSNEFADFGYGWEIHPAYRWALQPDSVEAIIRQLDLSQE